MADGDLKGRISALGQVAHTDGTATIVCSLTLPTADGLWAVTARVNGANPDHTAVKTISAFYEFAVVVHGGIAGLDTGAAMEAFGTTGYSAAASVTGSDTVVSIKVTAANGYRSICLMDAVGVVMAFA